MRLYTHDRFRFPLPDGHRFPIDKYALLRERLVAAGHDVVEAAPIPWEDLARVHSAAYLQRVRAGTLSVREQRGLGLPWSPQLVERARRTTGGTLAAARDALRLGVGMNLGGGLHHAGRDCGRGYCLVNDVAVAIAVLRAHDGLERAAVIDCDVHQGDGTAELLAADPTTFTLSLHGERNYPFSRAARSDLDVDLPSGTGDAAYLDALDTALDAVLAAGTPRLAFYLAGADAWEGDRLGRLALTKAGLRARDELVIDRLRAAGSVVCVVLAGGYAPDVRDTVDVNAATAEIVGARAGG